MSTLDLNSEQKKAIKLHKCNAFILAGAGSGKTRVLTQRIAYLCQEKHVSPLNILAVTFTNKAAREMRERVESLLGFSTHGMWIGTFHGIAHRLLRQHAPEIGFDKKFTVIDSDSQLQMIKKIMQSLNLDEAFYPPKSIQAYINDKKDSGKRSIDVNGNSNNDVYLKIYHAYELTMRADHLMDFADLLLYCYELLLNNNVLRVHYQKRFEYILVDEFQDTNTVQYRWLKTLVTDNNTIMAVGDDDQSIYGWRGAKIDNVYAFNHDFSPVTTVKLEQNYRSTKNILDAANHLIKNNEERVGKHLWSENPKGDLINLYQAHSERDEAAHVVEKIQCVFNVYGQYNKLAILYRSNAQSRVFEEALLKYAIPYRIYGGLRFFDRAEIKDTLAYMRLISQPNDNLAFERALVSPAKGIGIKTLDKIRTHASNYGISLWQASHEMIEHRCFASKTDQALAKFLQLITDIKAISTDIKLGDLTSLVIDRFDLTRALKKKPSEKTQQKLDNLEELINAAHQFVAPIEAVDEADLLAEFLSYAVLEAGDMQAKEYDDCVQMMTIHAAKGLEFSQVFIVGLEEGLFPSARSVDDAAKLDEERRLCYVGITRAMRNLHLSYATSRYQFGIQKTPTMSRFIKEIPEQFINNISNNKINEKLKNKNHFGVSVASFLGISNNKNSNFKAGDPVKHPKFGAGVFLKQTGIGDQAQYYVDFALGKKVLVASLCKLEKL